MKSLLPILLTCVASQAIKMHEPANPKDFQSALDTSKPGDIIQLLPIDYPGDFLLPSKSGSVRVQGKTSPKDPTKSTKIVGQGSVALNVTGDHWVIHTLQITSPKIALMVNGSSNQFKTINIPNSTRGIILQGDANILDTIMLKDGEEGLLIQGSENIIKTINLSGFSNFSMKIQAKSKGTMAKNVHIDHVPTPTTPSLILETGSQGLEAVGGHLDNLNLAGIIQVDGDGYKFMNLMSTDGLNVAGCGNTFKMSNLKKVWVRKGCGNDLTQMSMIKSEETKPIQ